MKQKKLKLGLGCSAPYFPLVVLPAITIESMKKKTTQDYWNALDLLVPKHDDGHKPAYCTDDAPNGWSCGCHRCDIIVRQEEKRKIKIWPRSKMVSAS